MDEPALHAPDLDAAVDVAAHLAALAPEAMTKGMFFDALFRRTAARISREALARMASIPPRRYLPFGDYPMRENILLTVAAAEVLFPRAPLGRALWMLGQGAFDAFLGSHMGVVLLGALSVDVGAILRVAPKVYRAVFNFGRVEYRLLSPGHGRFSVRAMPIFIETFQCGTIEGMLRHARASGRVELDVRSVSDAIVDVRWD